MHSAYKVDPNGILEFSARYWSLWQILKLTYNQKHFDNLINAYIDRIHDGIIDINNLKVKYRDTKPFLGFNQGDACDFEYLIHKTSVIYACIKGLYKSLNKTYPARENNEIFHEKTSDDDYIKFIRSLVTTHPLETSHHKKYTDNKTAFCPRVWWKSEHIVEATVYYVSDDTEPQKLLIPVDKVILYVQSRCDMLRELAKQMMQDVYAICHDLREEEIENLVTPMGRLRGYLLEILENR